jgi:hypothetical protein
MLYVVCCHTIQYNTIQYNTIQKTPFRPHLVRSKKLGKTRKNGVKQSKNVVNTSKIKKILGSNEYYLALSMVYINFRYYIEKDNRNRHKH